MTKIKNNTLALPNLVIALSPSSEMIAINGKIPTSTLNKPKELKIPSAQNTECPTKHAVAIPYTRNNLSLLTNFLSLKNKTPISKKAP